MIKKRYLFGALFVTGILSAQWTPTKFVEKGEREDFSNAQKKRFYQLDINEIRGQLKDAQLQGPNAKPVVVSVPMMNGKIERFSVYSFPVVVPSLAEQYQLGSYTGVSLENPGKLIRFSVAPNDFQSMVYDNGEYQFITPVDKSQGVYAVHYKSKPTGNKPFECSTEEGHLHGDIDNLRRHNTFANNPADFSRNSDRKYRTLRVVVSVTGEYTQAFGGTVAGALAQINATLTRVNGVFEKDFALHLNLQDYQNIIFTNASTDPYSDASGMSNWNLQLQSTLTNLVGDGNYDIGHLFGASGGGGNAGCIGCICVSPTTAVPRGKGSAYTSPASGLPMGDTFDIDYVAHEFGHQLGANHTFSHNIEGTGVNVEPGSGSTIMGYAGITGSATDVQANSDAYFHAASIMQVQNNLVAKTCDVEVDVANNPPAITAFSGYTIPKGTAFVLTGNATDPEGDAMTYTWEQINTATSSITKTNLGNTTHGGSFRSKLPSTSLVRYFPDLATVLGGSVRNVNAWESVSQVARSMNFRFTARDNNANATQQQTNYADQTITVGADGPFQVLSTQMNAGVATPFTWDVANTSSAPYGVTNVKIDYTTDNGANWTVLSASTPNDGVEDLVFPSSLIGQNVIARVSAIDNVFYAVKSVSVYAFTACDGTAPVGLASSNVTSTGAQLSWNPASGATYIVRYRVVGATNWTTVNTTTSTIVLSGLVDNTQYEVQVATVCGTTTGTFTSSVNFTTSLITYCTATSTNTSYEYIQNVTLANVNNTTTNGTYTNYSTNAALQINLTKGSQYTLSVTKGWMDNNPDYDAVSAWIDFNRNGVFEDSERVLTSAVTNTSTPVTATFTVPATAVEGLLTRMRVINVFGGSSNVGAILTNPCMTVTYGEVEDYGVMISPQMSTQEMNTALEVSIYPNPVADILNVNKVSNKAQYTIVNVAGQLVKQGTISDNKIMVSDLLRGNYIITVKDEGKSFSEKFIKK